MEDQQQIPPKGTNAYQEYVISLAKGPTLEEGVVNEPRVFYDAVVVPPDETVEVAGTPDAIFNRELFPVRLTHMTAAVGWDFAEGTTPSLIQTVGLQLRYHDQFYMNSNPVALPAWANKVTAAPDVMSGAMSAWDLIASGSRPVILSKQDTLQVDVRCDDPAATFVDAETPLDVTVSFTGFGALSRRPYFFSGTVRFTSIGTRKTIIPANYRNDGNEPIVITDMTVLVGPQVDVASFMPGDIRRVSLNVKQVGSGTGSWWFQSTLTDTLMPAALLGITTGRAVVHQFPGVGQQFNPADGITLAFQSVHALPNVDLPVDIAFIGYIMVT